jgi:hypothetical protein
MGVVGGAVCGLEAGRVGFGANRCVEVDAFVARCADPVVQCQTDALSVGVGWEFGRERGDGGEDRLESCRLRTVDESLLAVGQLGD